MNSLFVIIISLLYLGLLFFIAFWIEKYWHKTEKYINTSFVYALSLCAYCTAWTFYGSVGRASVRGIDFVCIYIGASMMAFVFPILGKKMIHITKSQHINSVADFISSRYGKNTSIGVLVALLSVIGMIPYIGLQLKAISESFSIISMPSVYTSTKEYSNKIADETTFYFTIILGIFIIIFGTKKIITTEKRPGLIATIAFESIIKLIAFISVGIFVVIQISSNWNAQYFSNILLSDYNKTLTLQGDSPYTTWLGLILLGAFSFIFLPRQFHLGIVENMNSNHTYRASWIFPFYLFLISLFVLPIAFLGNIILTTPNANADMYVLLIPLLFKQKALALLVFIGGFSAAISMIIVSTLSLTYMISNNIIMPLLLYASKIKKKIIVTDAKFLVLIRRSSILIVLSLAILFKKSIAENISLVSIGLISFVAISQLAPAAIFGMYWKEANIKGGFWGIFSGFTIWFYCLILPLFKNEKISYIVNKGLFGISFLRPSQLFGMTQTDSLTNGIFWSLSVNIFVFFIVSLLTKSSSRELYQAEIFVDIFQHEEKIDQERIQWRGNINNQNLIAVLSNFLGQERSVYLLQSYATRHKINFRSEDIADSRMINFTEKILSSAIGSASARLMIESVTKEMKVNIDEMLQIIRESQQIIQLNKELTKRSFDLQKASQQLMQANDTLKRIDEMKDEFLYTVTHEIRTPLTSIKALSELLYEQDDLTKEEKERCLQAIVKEADRLSKLVSEVLILEKLESGKYHIRYTTFNIYNTIQDTLISLDHHINNKRIAIVFEKTKMPLLIRGDENLILQALYNLISNAIKYVEVEKGKIILQLKQIKNNIILTISDNGKGIPFENQDKIFDKFFQAQNQILKKPEGSGLGLSIVKNIIELHHGEIELQSTENIGTTFTISLPIGL